MENTVRKLIIDKIWDVDSQNYDEFIEKIMFNGFSGYKNTDTIDLIRIYIE